MHAIAPLLTVILTLTLCFPIQANTQLPSIGNSSSELVSLAEEKKLGQYWLRSLRRQVELYHNPIVEEYFSHLVYSLAPASGVQDSDFSLVIINSPSLNAFAVPGSVMGINAGLFLHAASEQEFAAVIAHELAHLSQRHYARRLESQAKSQPLQLAGLLASVVVMATAGTEAGVAALASTQALGIEKMLSFSRENEQEADRLGIRILNESAFDPRAMPAMFERMFRQNRLQGQQVPEYLSTHPLSENRVADTRNRANQYPPRRYSDNPEYHFSKNIIIADYAESPERALAHFEQELGTAPSLRAHAAKYGKAYLLSQTNPQKSLELIRELERDFPGQISILILKAMSLHNHGDSEQAIALLETQLKRYPDNYPTAISLVNILTDKNQILRATGILNSLARSTPNNPRVWELLAETQGLAGNIVSLHQARAEYFQLHGNFKLALEQLDLAHQKSAGNANTRAKIQVRKNEIQALQKGAPF
ncbi:MAG: M48 family metalloprotease [Oleiphilaceae bacterium]|nr:M48 family metalloprotease [Oleiphilaceae bacterium]